MTQHKHRVPICLRRWCLVVVVTWVCTWSNLASFSLYCQTSTAETPVEYRLGNGDVLQISAWGEPQLSQRVMVRPDGKISMPLIGDVKVGDMTTDDAAKVLTEQLSRYLKHPQITILVAEVHSKLVYVTGEVQRPGAYPLLAPTNVVQLIARAGGVTAFAKTTKVSVLRKQDGARIPVNYKALLEGHHPEQNVELASGDTVVIP